MNAGRALRLAKTILGCLGHACRDGCKIEHRHVRPVSHVKLGAQDRELARAKREENRKAKPHGGAR